MIKLVLKTENLQHLEAFLGLAKVLEVSLEMGVEAPLPSPRPRRSTKAKKRKLKGSKRWARNMLVKTTALNSNRVPPRAFQAHEALIKEFGSGAFNKSLAKGVIAKRLKTLGASGLVTRLMDAGGLVAA